MTKFPNSNFSIVNHPIHPTQPSFEPVNACPFPTLQNQDEKSQGERKTYPGSGVPISWARNLARTLQNPQGFSGPAHALLLGEAASLPGHEAVEILIDTNAGVSRFAQGRRISPRAVAVEMLTNSGESKIITYYGEGKLMPSRMAGLDGGGPEPKGKDKASTSAAASTRPICDPWQEIMASADSKLGFLQNWQSGRAIKELTDEDELSFLTIAEESKGKYTESDMDDDVACKRGTTSTGSKGAGSCLLGFVHAINGKNEHVVGSIHVSGERIRTPGDAYEKIIVPLAKAASNELGENIRTPSFYFAGGNPDTIDSCVALAFAAMQCGIDVPVSMLGINDENSYVDAALTSNKEFYIAKVEEEPDEE